MKSFKKWKLYSQQIKNSSETNDLLDEDKIILQKEYAQTKLIDFFLILYLWSINYKFLYGLCTECSA